jgi:hypothetical protein
MIAIAFSGLLNIVSKLDIVFTFPYPLNLDIELVPDEGKVRDYDQYLDKRYEYRY